jgi:hypothetical protein
MGTLSWLYGIVLGFGLVAVSKFIHIFYSRVKKLKDVKLHYRLEESVTVFQKLHIALTNPWAVKQALASFRISLGLSRPLREGDAAPEVDLISLDGKTSVKLIEQYAASSELPLIINIGSFN